MPRCPPAAWWPSSKCGGVLGAAGAAAPSTLIVNALGAPISKDFTAAWQQFGLPAPTSSRVELLGNIGAIRFDPQGSATAPLFAAQEWGVYPGGAGVEQLARAKLGGLAATLASVNAIPTAMARATP